MADAEPEMIRLGSEFALVEVSKDYDANGARLKIYSSRTKRTVYLDPLLLEALTWTPREVIERSLETPFGPDSEDITSGPPRSGKD